MTFVGRILGASSALALLVVTAGCSESKTVGLIGARDRASPLSPGTRSELEARGATCTPNESGPVLCTWSGGGASCELTFDANDALTRLSCAVDGLTWTCTHPAGLYACAWSDDPGCADVYDLGGTFEAYLCGQALQDRLGQSAVDGGPSDFDGGVSYVDGGPSYVDGGPSDFDGGPRVDASSGWDAGPGPGCGLLDQRTCEATPSCHGVYVDDQACGCAPAGCCTRFLRCADGPADCTGRNVACDSLPPHCEGPYVVGYANACYEGCVLAASCGTQAVCGNGVLDPGETCDDANAIDGDGCSATCFVEAGWVCSAPGVPCTSAVACYPAPGSFPSFDASCGQDADCAVGIRQSDCCGTEVAVGVHPADLATFDDDARLCASQFPLCGCASRGIVTDDGSAANSRENVGVSCQRTSSGAGRCQTFVMP